MRKNTSLNKSLKGMIGIAFLILKFPANSFAMPVLKHVQVKNPSEFYLVFDGKVAESQISSEYVNDIFQINLKNVAVYPAKIIPIQGKFFSKIFAYQYSPKLVRCRFTLRGKVADLKRKIKIITKGEIVTVKLEQPLLSAKEQLLAQSTAQLSPKFVDSTKDEPEKVEKKDKEQLAADAEQAADALDEQALLQKVIRGTDSSQGIDKLEDHDSTENPLDAGSKELSESQNSKIYPAVKSEVGEKARLTGGKPLPPVWPVVAKLGLVILLLCSLAALGKKLKTTSAGKSWLHTLGKLAKKKLIKDREMIEIISTHHLDPKKSLAVVKIGGRLLVLGVSNEAINLITQLPGDGADIGDANILDFENDTALAQAGLANDPIFADFLNPEKVRPSSNLQSGGATYSMSSNNSDSPSLVPSARSRIKNRLEGLKQL
ncbi:MAG: flagellar biosynthetic protein FliO [Bdellovibrionia bacterium]